MYLQIATMISVLDQLVGVKRCLKIWFTQIGSRSLSEEVIVRSHTKFQGPTCQEISDCLVSGVGRVSEWIPIDESNEINEHSSREKIISEFFEVISNTGGE